MATTSHHEATAEMDHSEMDHSEHGADQSAHADHGGHEGHAEMFRRLFWANLVLAVPVLVFSGQIQEWLNYELSFPVPPGSPLFSAPSSSSTADARS